MPMSCTVSLIVLSSPSRGAWIEIVIEDTLWTMIQKSSPSRGAWIEIAGMNGNRLLPRVVPLAGGVD